MDMIANILRFTPGDVGVTLSGFLGVWLAVFSDNVISVTIAAFY
jgi:hypothetical protein